MLVGFAEGESCRQENHEFPKKNLLDVHCLCFILLFNYFVQYHLLNSPLDYVKITFIDLRFIYFNLKIGRTVTSVQ